jgi:hypothetical protein
MHPIARKKLANMLWPKFSRSVETLNRNAQMFSSIRGYDRSTIQSCSTRYDMYAKVNNRLADSAIIYLEFGVWKDESLAAWSKLDTNPHSMLYGFDSFEGLPEQWDHGFGHAIVKKRFDVGGAMPVCEDPRVKLVKG